MPSLEAILEPVLRSPQLVEAAALLNDRVEQERLARQRFYEEMTPEQKTEFIDGEVVLHSPASKRHLDATKRIGKLLDTHVELHCLGTVAMEKCLCVFPRNDYEPDIVFFGSAKAADLRPDLLEFPPPDLVIEVLSESTEARDRGVKFEDYAVHGVAEYWIVDTGNEVIEQYRPGPDGGYELAVKSSTGQLESSVVEGFSIPVRAIFDKAENLRALRSILESASK